MKLEVNLEKKYFYSILALLILIGGVFVVNALVAGETPNPGHNIQTVGPPTPCNSGQYLQFLNGVWVCATPSSSIPSQDFQVSVIFQQNTGDDFCKIRYNGQDFLSSGFSSNTQYSGNYGKACNEWLKDIPGAVDLYSTLNQFLGNVAIVNDKYSCKITTYLPDPASYGGTTGDWTYTTPIIVSCI